MKGNNAWQYHPYTRLIERSKQRLPYICRLAPQGDFCQLEWMDAGCGGPHTVCWWEVGREPEAASRPAEGPAVRLEGLAPQREYAVQVRRTEAPEEASDVRRFRTGAVPGTVINYLHPKDDIYSFSGHCLCSPAIVELPSGQLLVSMDVYASRHAQNLTLLYTSDDNGATWQYCNDLFHCFWGKPFVHRGALYMLAVSSEYGFLMIGRSDDEGRTWTPPVALFPGCGIRDEMGMHQAPTPVISHNGRLWSAVDYGTWERGGHSSGLVSIDENADLLEPSNWSCTEFLPFSHEWPGAVPESRWGLLEGNAVAAPDGTMYNMLRYQITYVFRDDAPRGAVTHGLAALLKAAPSDPEKQLTFDRFIRFNGGMSKFQVRRDGKTGWYAALVNRVADDSTPAQRNILSLAVSENLFDWKIAADLIDASAEDPELVGFQYPDFLMKGDDLLYVSRTAWNGAVNFHDSNHITFHRLPDFRQYFK